ncbi:PIN domain-containing protein [Amycolatopsis jiangsuensis]|uniref:Putative nucleic acid-binding protein n=1 Tax=Amycolatopsis jiangsuensis TaxID=1181879 RepID=A0A840J2H8_9PSEU|nr:type II toxin-antitoxin system VapC family toxin [Amycolatopsis jiangsuensis]MBB4687474.1 putative nucleic acid-binding protein [Amycolatopsis jiangsuensis]
MAERAERGVLDTCAYLDLALLDPETLPRHPELTSVTMAELHQGVAMAKDPVARAARTEQTGAAMVDFAPTLPFDNDAAARYGSLVALTVGRRRDPRSHRLDLMIAAIASVHELPLYTRNAADFAGLESMVDVVAL